MKSNASKCHLLVRTNNTANVKKQSIIVTNSTYKKRLRVKFDYTSTFDDHISKISEKVSRKLHALARVKNECILQSQFSYCLFGLDVS